MPTSPLTGPDSHAGPHAHALAEANPKAQALPAVRRKPQSPSPTCSQEKTHNHGARTGSTCTHDPHTNRIHMHPGSTWREGRKRELAAAWAGGQDNPIHHSKAVHRFRRDNTPQQGSAPVPQGQMRMWGPQQHLEGAPMLETAKGQPHRQGHSQAMHHRRAPLSPEGLVMFFKGTATLGHSQAMHHQRNHWRPGWRSPGCHSPRRLLLRGHRRAGERGRAVLQQQPLYPARPCYSHATAAAKPGPAMLQPCYNGR